MGFWDSLFGGGSSSGSGNDTSSGKDGSSSSQTSHDVKAVGRSDGKTDVYFGGDGRADGRGHGHIVWNPDRNSADYVREAERDGGGVQRDDRRPG